LQGTAHLFPTGETRSFYRNLFAKLNWKLTIGRPQSRPIFKDIKKYGREKYW
jgi:hypothetical protein